MTDKGKWEQFNDEQARRDSMADQLREDALKSKQQEEQQEVDDVESADVEQESDQVIFDDTDERLSAMELQVAEYKDQAARAAANVENMKRRMEREISQAHKFGTERLIKSLVPVLDSFSQGLEQPVAEDPKSKALHEGMEMTQSMFEKALIDNGLEIIDPQIGEAFNPEYHEAMSVQPLPGADPNTVSQVLRKGYQLNGRVLRAAMVMVTAS